MISESSCHLNQLILNSLYEGVCCIDTYWKIIRFNQALTKITGIEGEDALNKEFTSFFTADDCVCRSQLSTALSGTPTNNVVTVIQHRSQKQTPVSVSTVPIRDEGGAIVGAIATIRDISSEESLRKRLHENDYHPDIIGKSESLHRILDILPDIAVSDSSTVILGDSGTGKELIAQAIHDNSNRTDKPFVAVNCGALPDSLIESELFGYKKGAFTDAKSDKPGRFALAEKGTIFLDEVGELSEATQVKLLRVLQEKEYEPLGARAPVACNVRIIAATNRNLTQMVDAGTFRPDLYYRLSIVTLQLPSLKERREDIPFLVDHFIAQLNAEKNRSIRSISSDALQILCQYDFPGNIRELRNIIEHCYIFCKDDDIAQSHLPEYLLTSFNSSCFNADALTQSHNGSSMEDVEKRAIIDTLKRFDGNRKDTAAVLNIDKSTLYRKMKRHGISWS